MASHALAIFFAFSMYQRCRVADSVGRAWHESQKNGRANVKTSRPVEITPWMSAYDARDALERAKSKGATVQRVNEHHGELVVYLSKPTLKDRLLMAFMPSEMRRDARTSVDIVLREITKNCGQANYDAVLAPVRDAIVHPSGTLEINTSMDLAVATHKLSQAEAKGASVKRWQKRDDEVVIYLRKPNLKDRLRTALMPSQMRREAQSMVNVVLQEIAKRRGIPENSALLCSVRDAIGNGSKDLDKQLFLLQFE